MHCGQIQLNCPACTHTYQRMKAQKQWPSPRTNALSTFHQVSHFVKKALSTFHTWWKVESAPVGKLGHRFWAFIRWSLRNNLSPSLLNKPPHPLSNNNGNGAPTTYTLVHKINRSRENFPAWSMSTMFKGYLIKIWGLMLYSLLQSFSPEYLGWSTNGPRCTEHT